MHSNRQWWPLALSTFWSTINKDLIGALTCTSAIRCTIGHQFSRVLESRVTASPVRNLSSGVRPFRAGSRRFLHHSRPFLRALGETGSSQELPVSSIARETGSGLLGRSWLTRSKENRSDQFWAHNLSVLRVFNIERRGRQPQVLGTPTVTWIYLSTT